MGNVAAAKTKVTNLLNQKKVKTFTVAYGGGISSSGIKAFNDVAKAGGTSSCLLYTSDAADE